MSSYLRITSSTPMRLCRWLSQSLRARHTAPLWELER
nr:MAG TPA: hypothetical protein [Caudoviricetes sp.]